MLPHDVGASLAAETAEVEDALAAGDNEAAREEALDLRDRVNIAIEAGEVPESVQRPLLAAVNRLIASIAKDEPPPPDEDEEDDDKGKGNDDNNKGKGKGNDDKEATTSTEVTTLAETVTDGGDNG